MKISVQVKPGSRTNTVEQIDDTHLIIRVKAKPHDGKANDAVLKLLAAHLVIPLSSFTIRFGHTSKYKIIEIK